MADGGERPITRVEMVAGMLAASSGTGSFLRADVGTVGKVSAETRGEVVGIAWKGTREESAARSIGNGSRASALHAWSRDSGVSALPSFRPDRDAIVAMGRVEAVPAALLRVYALEAWHEWSTVEAAALVVIAGRGAREAVCDAMGRILWRVAAVSQDGRARALGMRAGDYRALPRKAEGLLWRWLDRAAGQFMDRLREIKRTRKAWGLEEPRPDGRSPCGFKSETWWHPERPFRTDLHPTDGIQGANTTPPQRVRREPAA